jgi:tetratricopeptide (TPR) repeat protein
MKFLLKAICFILFFLLPNTPAKTQQAFTDSIRNMLVDLDEQIQYEPINQLLQNTIPFCRGDTVNDSLKILLKLFFSDDYFYKQGLLQSVSSHLRKKYDSFIMRIITYVLQTDPDSLYQENMLSLGFAELRLRGGPHNEIPLKIFLQLKFEQPYQAARLQYYLAEAYMQTNNTDSVFLSYRRSLQLNPGITTEESELYINSLLMFADFCRINNEPDSALLLLKQAQFTSKRTYGDKNAMYGLRLINIADYYMYMSKYTMSRELLFEALQITQHTLGEENNQYALCLAEIGEVYYRTGEYEKALGYSQRALDIKMKIFGSDYFDNVVNLHDVALLYIRMGLYDAAIPLLKHSLFISKKYFGESVVYALDLESLAEVHAQLGNMIKPCLYTSRPCKYRKAVQKKMGKKGFYYPRVLHGIASLFTKLGQYDKAIESFKEALEIKRKVFGEINPEYTKTLNSYAEVYLLKGDYKKALQLQKESIDITRNLFGEMHPDMAAGYYTQAVAYYNYNNFKMAEEFCNKALQLQIKIFGPEHPAVANSYDLLGNINLQLHRNDEALTCYQSAFGIRKKMMNVVHPDYIKSLYNLAVIYIKEKRYTSAAALLTTADSAALVHIENSYGSLSEEEKLIYLHNRENEFQYLPSLLYLHKVNDPALQKHIYSNAISLKSMVLFHQQQVYNSIRESSDSNNSKLYNTWRFNKAFLGKQILLPAGKRLPGFDSLTDVTNQMEQQLSRISQSFRNNNLLQVTGIEKIIQQLSQHEAMIEFIRFRLYNNSWTDSIIYAALILLPGNTNVAFVPLFEERQLKALLRFSNNSGEAAVNYLYPAANDEAGISSKLYKLIWQPLQPLLDNVHTVYYSPCGLLYRVSFAALYAGNNKMLIDDYTLQQLLCTRNLLTASQGIKYFTAASLWGDIDYNTPNVSSGASIDSSAAYSSGSFLNVTTSNNEHVMLWQSLPGTKKETENIYKLLREKNIACTLITAGEADEEAFKKMDGHAPELIHIATHGFFLRPAVKIQTENNNIYAASSFSGQKILCSEVAFC